jgi:hypothetical protein
VQVVVEAGHEVGIWRAIFHAKYLRNDNVKLVKHKHDGSPVWSDLL